MAKGMERSLPTCSSCLETASAADGSNALAMLVRRDGETLSALLKRLDKAIAVAYDEGPITDEVNVMDD